MKPVILLFYVFSLLCPGLTRRHTLRLKNELRRAALCSNFGFSKGGIFSVSIEQLSGELHNIFFSLDKGGNSGMSSVLEAKQNGCFRGEFPGFLYLSFDPDQRLMLIHNKDLSLQNLIFEYGFEDYEDSKSLASSLSPLLAIHSALSLLELVPHNDSSLSKEITDLLQSTETADAPQALDSQASVFMALRRLAQSKLPSTRLLIGPESKLPVEQPRNSSALPPSVATVLETVYKYTNAYGSLRVLPYGSNRGSVDVQFTVRFPNSTEEGFYSFYIHNCPPPDERRSSVNITLKMVEKNPDSYLSVGQQPLPLLYSVLCCLYLLASFFWFMYLRVSKNSKFRMHYLMFVVVLTKAISVAFHGINFYVIGKHGVPEEGWAVMYYITHIIRGALLFITILLIGAGWAFIKRMLTPRERNLFLIVIPLQILANIATVVIEESEAGMTRYALWKDIFIFVDLACCGAILFPVVWSIRHLQTASQTDGKAAINLRNLRLFRHFYISVICYVYFTRVIAYLLSITVVYSLTWLIELFKESVTFVFFVSVGYTFRPVNDNPYLLVSTEEDDEEDTVMERIQLEDVWSQSGAAENVTRLSRQPPKRSINSTVGQTNPAFTDLEGANDQFDLVTRGEEVP